MCSAQLLLKVRSLPQEVIFLLKINLLPLHKWDLIN
jgi:hypothetical protein